MHNSAINNSRATMLRTLKPTTNPTTNTPNTPNTPNTATTLLQHHRATPTANRRRHKSARADNTVGPIAASDFHELRERALLRHVVTHSDEGEPESVLAAMDDFWDHYYESAGTNEWKLRSAALDATINDANPNTVMELGTYCGYTAVRIGRLLKPGAKMVSVEVEPLFAAIASKVVEHAGLRDVVTVRIGTVVDQLDRVHDQLGSNPLDALLLDHDVDSYLPDLQHLESKGMIAKNTAVLCDWNLYPGSEGSKTGPKAGKEFLEYMKARAQDKDALHTARHMLDDKDVFTVTKWSGVV